MPDYTLTVRSDRFALDLSLTFWLDDPLGFTIQKGTAPSEGQLIEIIQALKGDACGSDRAYMEAFDTLMDLLKNRVLRGIGTEEDEEDFREFGRLLGVASYFDAGAMWLCEQLGKTMREVERYLGEERKLAETAMIEELLTRVRGLQERGTAQQQDIVGFEELRVKWRTNEHYLLIFVYPK